ncbi:hypothetical protein EIP91_004746 [Steccherinum ochraceum]|uniref:YDG domain-containing protein n=1 Tax=Steccherinum ochraceum TaxID=92696 RepID=A0A4R0RAT6_9APHY|nr:hypothetical protein EIP91_004746 [Steccherinum ochraceum]
MGLTPDPHIFGHVDPKHNPIGTTWATRKECSESRVHPGLLAGIFGSKNDGAYSVVLSGGYKDDVDEGETFTYTGAGGHDKHTVDGKARRVGPQKHDQTFDHPPNRALLISSKTGRPVRVVRGYKLMSIYAPPDGYRYDGLYRVVEAKLVVGKSGFKVCQFKFERLPGQGSLPIHSYHLNLNRVKKSDRAKLRDKAEREAVDSGARDGRPQASSSSAAPIRMKAERKWPSSSIQVKDERKWPDGVSFVDRPPGPEYLRMARARRVDDDDDA